MRLDQPLLKLPLRFDADAIAAEMSALPADAWVPHPNKLPGNEAVRLVTTRGGDTDDTAAPMAPTRHLLASPYIMQVMAAIGGTWGRSRLMRLAAGSVVPAHVDTHYYWRTHVRLHVPIVTNPHVAFTCSGETVHMAASAGSSTRSDATTSATGARSLAPTWCSTLSAGRPCGIWSRPPAAARSRAWSLQRPGVPTSYSSSSTPQPSCRPGN